MDERIKVELLFGGEIKILECYEDCSHNFASLKSEDWTLENLQVLTAHLMGQLARNTVKEQESLEKTIASMKRSIAEKKLTGAVLTQVVLLEQFIADSEMHDFSLDALTEATAANTPKVNIDDKDADFVNSYNLLESVAAFMKIQRAKAGRDGVIKGRHQISQAAKDWVVVRRWHDLREACKPIPSGKTHHKDTEFARDVINTTGAELKEKTITDTMRKWRKEAKQGKKPS